MRPVSRDKAAHLAVTVAAQPGTRSGATCSAPPRLDCPEANCPVDQVRAEGNAVEPKSGRKFFFDYPCDLKPYVYSKCRDGRIVADFIRLDKGHTERLEPNVLDEVVKLMISARGGKARTSTSDRHD